MFSPETPTNTFLTRCSAVIIVKNAGKTLGQTLAALQDFAEVVVYDNGSDDDSLHIAAQFANVRLYQGEFLGFGASKNHAATLAKYDWIFSLDADEVPNEVLRRALAQFDDSDNTRVGEILRVNSFCGKIITTNGWNHDRLIRLYHRRTHRFCNRTVHEQVITDRNSRKISLDGYLLHRTVDDLAQHLQKMDYYAELYARSQEAKLYPFPWIVIKTLFAFCRSYLLKGGILGGWRGFSIAFGESVGVFYKYAKVYARKHSPKTD